MKKLLIAMAIVCAAVAANADSWHLYAINEISNAEGGGFYSGSARIYCEDLSFDRTITVDGGLFDLYEDIACTSGGSYTFTLTAATATHTYLATASSSWYESFDLDAGGNLVWSYSDPVAPFTPGTWTAVPEPTSALLLLLGMAGLALKRKRA